MVASVNDLSDQDMLIQYCLQNKINKTAVDELLKRGYDSLDALKLVNIEDLGSQNIPMGQRRLILHIAQALNENEATAQRHTPASGSVGNTGISNARQTGNQQDPYNEALLNTLLSQQAQLSAAASPNVTNGGSNAGTVTDQQRFLTPSGTVPQATQPSWSDPQIHIASATGKSTVAFYDICDFVPHTVDEDLVVGGQGDQQLVVKSGPKKPKL